MNPDEFFTYHDEYYASRDTRIFRWGTLLKDVGQFKAGDQFSVASYDESMNEFAITHVFDLDTVLQGTPQLQRPSFLEDGVPS